jgi:hypothetical protein
MWNEPGKEKLDQIPRLYETENIPLKEKLIHLHFFIFETDFYICEYDGKDTFWGFVILNNDLEMAEWGYINFSELKSINVNGFEVDCELEEFWEVCPAKKIARICKAQNWQFTHNEDNKGGSHGVHTRT